MLVRAGANFLSPVSAVVSFARRLVRVWRTKQAHYTLQLVAIPKTRAHTHPSYVVLLHFGILVKQSSLLCCRYCDVRDWQPKGLLISTGDEAAANARPSTARSRVYRVAAVPEIIHYSSLVSKHTQTLPTQRRRMANVCKVCG